MHFSWNASNIENSAHSAVTLLLDHIILMSEMWNVTWDPVHLYMTDSQRWTSAGISQSWHCFKPQTVTHVNHNHTHHPPYHLHTRTHRVCPVCTSIAIIHQIYLHWSRAKIKPAPLRPPTSPRQPRPNPITARYWLWLIGFQSNWISLRWRWGGGQAALLKAIRHWHWQEGDVGQWMKTGRQKREKRDGRRREVIERDWGCAR